MSETKHRMVTVEPVAGRLVRHEITRRKIDKPCTVRETPYILRRLKSGDLATPTNDKKEVT